MTRTLYGRPNSINVQKARWTLAEIGLDYRHVETGRGYAGGNDEAWFLELNPNGTVPVLDDGDGTVLWESNAIVRYLAARYDGGGLWPEEASARADSDRWMDWQLSVLSPAIRPAFWQLIRTPERERDDGVVQACAEKANAAFAVLDAALAGRRFIHGPQPTIGDIPLGATAHRWFQLPMPRARVPNVEAYYERLQTRPAFRDTVMIPLS